MQYSAASCRVMKSCRAVAPNLLEQGPSAQGSQEGTPQAAVQGCVLVGPGQKMQRAVAGQQRHPGQRALAQKGPPVLVALPGPECHLLWLASVGPSHWAQRRRRCSQEYCT